MTSDRGEPMNLDLKELRRLAERARPGQLLAYENWEARLALTDEITPETLLALLDRLEAAEARAPSTCVEVAVTYYPGGNNVMSPQGPAISIPWCQTHNCPPEWCGRAGEAESRAERLEKALDLYKRKDGKFRECQHCDGINSPDCHVSGCRMARAALAEAEKE